MLSSLTALIIAWGPVQAHPEQVAMLYQDASVESGIDVVTLVAVSYHESRLRTDRVSGAGACGIMQVIPKWSRWSCDDMQSVQAGISAGVEALQYWDGSLEHYGGGNRGSRRYARTVQRYRRQAIDIIAKAIIERTPY